MGRRGRGGGGRTEECRSDLSRCAHSPELNQGCVHFRTRQTRAAHTAGEGGGGGGGNGTDEAGGETVKESARARGCTGNAAADVEIC